MMNKNSRGMALAIVICAMALVIALGTAALVAANSAFAASTDNISQQQAYLAASSFCDVLRAALEDGADPVAQQAFQLTDGQSMTINADSAQAGDIGTAECTLLCSGATLKVTVNAHYNGEASMLVMRMRRGDSAWVFDTFTKVD